MSIKFDGPDMVDTDTSYNSVIIEAQYSLSISFHDMRHTDGFPVFMDTPNGGYHLRSADCIELGKALQKLGELAEEAERGAK